MDDISPYSYLLLVLLMGCSAFFSSTETAFSSLNRIRLKNMAAQGNKRARKVLDTADDFERTLSTILIGNNLVNIAAATVGAVIFTKWFGYRGAGISTVTLTILILLFSEILPKSYAKLHADSFALRVVGVLRLLIVVFMPISFLLLRATHFLSRGKHLEKKAQPIVTEQELKYLIEESENDGVLEQQESELVQSALEFDEITVDEVLTPRVDVVAIEQHMDPELVKQLFLDEAYSRLPVYQENIDHIVGVVYFKDFFKQYTKLSGEMTLASVMQKIARVPQKKPISELMKELQRLKMHMAVVTDQYGGTVGIITLEDVLEQLVGEIWDESDEEEQLIIKIDAAHYDVQGDLNPEDFLDLIGLTYDDEQLDALPNSFAGLALETLGYIPAQGEFFCYRHLKITILELVDQRITRVAIEVMQSEE